MKFVPRWRRQNIRGAAFREGKKNGKSHNNFEVNNYDVLRQKADIKGSFRALLRATKSCGFVIGRLKVRNNAKIAKSALASCPLYGYR